MAKTVNEIKSDIDSARLDLRANLNDVGNRIRSMTDWRRLYREHRGEILVSAMVGGFAMAQLVSRRRRMPCELPSHTGAADILRKNVAEVQTAIMGLIFTHAKRLIGKCIPGFADHLPKSSKAGD